MNLKCLARDYYVADQLQPEDLEQLARRGIRSIINVRPDGESDDQPSGDDIRIAAQAVGLDYVSVPVANKDVTPVELDRFRAALDPLPLPVCAFCRTGTRAMVCWALTQLGTQATYAIVDAVEGAGFPSDDLRCRLGRELNPAVGGR